LANETILEPKIIEKKCTEKLATEFFHIRAQASEPLAKFMDYITYAYMIDNICLLIRGTLNNKDAQSLISECHPLGMFESMATLTVANNVSELYHSVIVDTPLAPYFLNCLSEEDLQEIHIEVIRNSLFKEYLEDFYRFSQDLGGVTADVVGEILQFEADRRAINITWNGMDTELSKDDREKLYPHFGLLWPEGSSKLAKAESKQMVREICDIYAAYKPFFEDDLELETAFNIYEVKLNRMSFEQHFHYGVFYSLVKLKEQEIRNIVWISECIRQDMKPKINQYIPIF